MDEVDFFGEKLGVYATVSDFARAELAEANSTISEGDARSEMAATAALLAFVEDCVLPDHRVRFRQLARQNRASFDDLNAIVIQVAERQAGRPTGGSVDSSAGPSVTPPTSGSSVDDKVAEMFPGRPDKQAALRMARSA